MDASDLGPESQTLEFKSSKEAARDIAKTVCAFANTEGGRVVFGIANDGTVIGIPGKDMDHTQQVVNSAIQQISPVPFASMRMEKLNGEWVLVCDVLPIGRGTFCTVGGIVYYRSGSSNVKLEGKTLQDYLVTRRVLNFDEMLTDAGLDDMDQEKSVTFFKKRSPDLHFEENKMADIMRSIGVGTFADNRFRIKNMGVLFFARRLNEFIPQAEIKMARFRGTEPVEIIDARFVCETIPEALRQAEDFVKRNTRLAFVVDGMERKEVPEYPDDVVREVLVNAIGHRDYFSQDAIQINIFDDRIEVINPGKLPQELEKAMFGSMSVQRNPSIYRMMRDIDLVEGLATGIPRIRSTLRKSGYPEPLFEEIGSFFRVTLRNREWHEPVHLSDRQRIALDRTEKEGRISSAELAKMTKVSVNIAVSDLNGMCELGLLQKIGKTRGAYYVLGGMMQKGVLAKQVRNR